MSIRLNKLFISEDTLQKILDFLPYPFLVSESKGGAQLNAYVNKKFLEEIGYTLQEIPTINDWFQIAYPDADYREQVEEKWYELLRKAREANEDSVVLQVLIQTKNLGKRWYEVKSSIADPIQMVAFIDIHGVKSQEENLKRLNENRDRILSILGHDLRGPLAQVHTLSKMAMKQQLSQQDYEKMISEVNVKAFHTMEFLSTTLAWAKSNFDSIKVKYESVRLNDLVSEIVSLYSEAIAAKNIKVEAAIDPSLHIQVDREIITTVIRNLLFNAIKFSHNNRTITLRAINQPNNIVIEIEDQGIGMDQEKIKSILSNRYSSDAGTSGEKGLGIGIMLCVDLLTRMNGKLGIESERGAGTTMKIVLKNFSSP